MSLPKAYIDELDVLNREITKQQPEDVLQFCANYFNNRLQQHRRELLGQEQSQNETPPLFNVHSFSDDPTTKAIHADDDPHSSAPPRIETSPVPSENRIRNASLLNPSLPSAGFPQNFYFNVNRRTSVSAESLDPSKFSNLLHTWGGMPVIGENTLDPEKLERLNKSVAKNFLFSNLDEDSLHSVLNALQEKKVSAKQTIITQGDEGDFFYIVESGIVEFYRDGEQVSSSTAGSSFGELALMYNAPRAATVVAATDCVLWALDRVTFKKILLHKTACKRSMYEEFLKSVPILKVLSPYELSKLSDALHSKTFESGQVVIKEGDVGDEFYLVESGTATISKQTQGVVNQISKGDYFGEVALLNDLPRQATVTATSKLKVATLGRSGFQRLLGHAVDILKRQDPTHVDQAAQSVVNQSST